MLYASVLDVRLDMFAGDLGDLFAGLNLEAELERGQAAIAAGEGISADELLARVRET